MFMAASVATAVRRGARQMLRSLVRCLVMYGALAYSTDVSSPLGQVGLASMYTLLGCVLQQRPLRKECVSCAALLYVCLYCGTDAPPWLRSAVMLGIGMWYTPGRTRSVRPPGGPGAHRGPGGPGAHRGH
jgi:hypothetical protein